MMKITGLSHLFKWENLHNWWLTKSFFCPTVYDPLKYIFVHFRVKCTGLMYFESKPFSMTSRRVCDKMDRWLLKREQAPPTEDKHAKKKKTASKIPPVS